jgi:hypothetical protein
MKKYTISFEIETIQAGQKQSYGDSYYTYKVTSTSSEQEVKGFCMNSLRISYKKEDMPDPFAGELLEFKKLTDNNEGKGFLDSREPETYSYKTRNIYTG